jgi:hypothetical protein
VACRYALLRTGLVALGSAGLAALTETGWLGVEYALFIVGVLGVGYGAFTARPAPPWARERADPGGRNRGFDALLASGCMLALSFGIERLFVP